MASGGPGKYPSWIRHMLCPYWEIFREGSSPATRGQTSAMSTKPRMECVRRHDFIASPLDLLPPIDGEKPQPGRQSEPNRDRLTNASLNSVSSWVLVVELTREALASWPIDPQPFHLGHQRCSL